MLSLYNAWFLGLTAQDQHWPAKTKLKIVTCITMIAKDQSFYQRVAGNVWIQSQTWNYDAELKGIGAHSY